MCSKPFGASAPTRVRGRAVPDPRSIALTKLALWYDPTRIQTWPSFLAALPAGALARSPTALGLDFVTARVTSAGHAAAFDLVRNLPGLEFKAGRLQLRGLGLLVRSPAGYAVSASGQALAAAYSANPEGADWVRLLTDALLGREPRTRALIKLLSADGTVLRFERGTWFSGSYRRARLERTGEPAIFPLDAAKGRPTRTAPLQPRRVKGACSSTRRIMASPATGRVCSETQESSW
jgi:hypothetical protein